MKYGSAYFSAQKETLRSARAVVPRIAEMVQPRSVVDVGCGIGVWLSGFVELGVTDIIGVDGAYVPRDLLVIPQDRFRAADLTQPLQLGRTFDVALSLEVAEHLPGEVAGAFVASLTSLAPVVIFSAAIPIQGGRGHVNEQWQTYWARLFGEQGFVAVDAIRPEIWTCRDVDWWYRQNTIVYVREERLASYKLLAEARQRTDERMLDIVHPVLLAKRNRRPLRPFAKAAVLRSWLRL